MFDVPTPLIDAADDNRPQLIRSSISSRDVLKRDDDPDTEPEIVDKAAEHSSNNVACHDFGRRRC